MSEITIKMFPAKNGDCFLVSLGLEKKKHILIDCGYAETYNKFLKDELKIIASNNEMIDLMVISHVDEDHILGAISLLDDNNKKSFIKIKEIWHNSYRHLQFNKEKVKEITSKEEGILQSEIRLGSSFVDRKKQNEDNQDISVGQGSSLASLILEGQYSWNKSFNNKAINIDNKSLIRNDDYNIRLLSPNSEKLNKLSDKWFRELQKMRLGFSLSDESIFDDAYEFHMIQQYERKIEEKNISSTVGNKEVECIEDVILSSLKEDQDESIVNGSSISFIIEYRGKRLLFLADAHPDIIVDGILKLENDHFDLIKVSHHGSVKNITSELAKILSSDLFLISTNGKSKHSHPNFEALAKIIYHQNNPKKLVFNYKTRTSKKLDNDNWKIKYNYDLNVNDGTTPTIIEL